ncbi:MAG: Plug domain-containing protein, partial [Bacteroidia bacterium]|nr:Plug domain-containing protein [Bacteroidia bacterium]
MQKNKSVILLLYVCCANFINAQPLDSIQKINPVIITASRLQNFSSGTKLLVFDSTVLSRYSSGNLADLLGAESHLFIKSYGLGSLATSSFRGGGASHTALLWNGFNLNNPMYGQFDLSLIPNYFADKVVVQYGGTAALWGSGAVGGAIHLNNEANFNKGLSLACGSSFGSFGTLVQNLQAQVSTKSWVTSLKVFNTTAENNFPYYNTMLPGSPKQIQKNNSLQEYGVLSENYFKINNRQKINLFFWYQ